jgi:hypothetical protein
MKEPDLGYAELSIGVQDAGVEGPCLELVLHLLLVLERLPEVHDRPGKASINDTSFLEAQVRWHESRLKLG